jgi:BirA family transcriptional regulator, biotin operon repressor / biotin---[acetyl-CoA-carboxylase] ligase
VIAWRLESYDALESTSDTCVARAKAGEPEGLAVLALRQTSGRGSRGRQWQSLAGNLNLSLLLRPRLPASESGVFPLLAGVAVAKAVETFLPDYAVPMLKWPNDVLLGGAKLAGILIDAAPRGALLDWLVIGVGINLAQTPEIPGRLTTKLAAHGGHAEPLAAAQAVLNHLAFWLDRLSLSGAAPILDTWLERAHPIGTELQVRGAQDTINGRFAGLSSIGELLLNVENRIERFQTGEILLGIGG